jgi:TPR repeat protein
MYYKGEGVPQDYTEVAKWFRLAADQGNSEAQYSLGVMYHEGEGVPQNSTEAAKSYRLAANQGYTQAQLKSKMQRASDNHQLRGIERSIKSPRPLGICVEQIGGWILRRCRQRLRLSDRSPANVLVSSPALHTFLAVAR